MAMLSLFSPKPKIEKFLKLKVSGIL